MEHTDHVALIKKGVTQKGGVWADIGSGTGAFTLALRELLGEEGKIFSVDRDRESLMQQKNSIESHFAHRDISYIAKDYREKLYLPMLDGMVMANSLHFVESKKDVLAHLMRYIKKNGRFVLVEYNVDVGNQWVPYPLSFQSFSSLCSELRWSRPEKIGSHPSHFLDEIYSAVSIVL